MSTPRTDAIPRRGPFHHYVVDDVLDLARQLESELEEARSELEKARQWALERDATIQRINGEREQADFDNDTFRQIMQAFDGRFGCGHAGNGSEDCWNHVQHVDELFKDRDSARNELTEARNWQNDAASSLHNLRDKLKIEQDCLEQMTMLANGFHEDEEKAADLVRRAMQFGLDGADRYSAHEAIETGRAMLAFLSGRKVRVGTAPSEKPCCHEWFEGRCVHCEITPKEFRAQKENCVTNAEYIESTLRAGIAELKSERAKIADYLWPNQTGMPNEHRDILTAIVARENLRKAQYEGALIREASCRDIIAKMDAEAPEIEKLTKANARLRKALAGLVGEDTTEGLKTMQFAIRTMVWVPDADRAATLNAIAALLGEDEP